MGSLVTNSVSNDRKLLQQLLDSLREQEVHAYRYDAVPTLANKKHHKNACHQLTRDRFNLISSLTPKVRSAPPDSKFSITTTTTSTFTTTTRTFTTLTKTTTTTTATTTLLKPRRRAAPVVRSPLPSPTARIFGRAALHDSQPRGHKMQRRGTPFHLQDAPARGRKRKPGRRLFKNIMRKMRTEGALGEEKLVVDLVGDTTDEEEEEEKENVKIKRWLFDFLEDEDDWFSFSESD